MNLDKRAEIAAKRQERNLLHADCVACGQAIGSWDNGWVHIGGLPCEDAPWLNDDTERCVKAGKMMEAYEDHLKVVAEGGRNNPDGYKWTQDSAPRPAGWVKNVIWSECKECTELDGAGAGHRCDYHTKTQPDCYERYDDWNDCACCTGSGGHNGHCDECIKGPAKTAEDDYYIMTDSCPECKKAWPKGSEFELCEASKLYKRKGYLNRTCDDCGVITFTFWVEKY